MVMILVYGKSMSQRYARQIPMYCESSSGVCPYHIFSLSDFRCVSLAGVIQPLRKDWQRILRQ